MNRDDLTAEYTKYAKVDLHSAKEIMLRIGPERLRCRSIPLEHFLETAKSGTAREQVADP